MAERESLADKAVSTVAAISEIERLLHGTNDFGDATGFCEEYQTLSDDASDALRMLRRRAYILKKRFERTNAS